MLVAHASNGRLKIAALSTYWKDAGIFPDEQCGFRPARGEQSTRCLLCADGKNSDELGKTPLYECFIDLQKARLRRPAVAADGARTLWRVPDKMLTVFRRFHASCTQTCKLACALMTASTRNGLTSPKGCSKNVCFHGALVDVFFAAAIPGGLAGFSEDPDVLKDLVGRNAEPLARVRRVV